MKLNNNTCLRMEVCDLIMS